MSKKNIHPIVSGAGWIGSFAGALVNELEKLGVSFESIHKLNGNTKEGRMLVRACAEKIAKSVKGVLSDFLELISGNESLILDPVDGKETLTVAKDVFAYIDSDFKNYGAGEKGPATEATPVRVYELTKDATFPQLFGSLSSDVNKLCLTQAQIKGFVKKYRNWLRVDGYATFFLFESNKNFFVACVHVLSDGTLKVFVYRLVYSSVWFAEDRHRVVVPQLAWYFVFLFFVFVH